MIRIIRMETVAAAFALLSSLGGSAFAATNPVPLISQPLVPASAAPGGAGFTLRVNGAGFANRAVVNWNGSPRATTFKNPTRLTATILGSDIEIAGTASVTVVNPPPGGGTSNVAFFQIAQRAPAVGWLNPTEYSVGQEPIAGAVADFNGDGILDLAVANYDEVPGTVSVLLGNGDGTFQAGLKYSVAYGDAEFLTSGDFNGDGKPDLAVSSGTNPAAVSILLGNGDGSFQPHVDYPVGGLPGGVVSGDFNRDGKLDLALGGSPNSVTVLLGNGDGTFQAYRQYSAGGWLMPAVGDFNRDGKLDLAIANGVGPSGEVGVVLGNGDGTFQPPVEYAAGSEPVSVATADFDGDGKLDLAVANAGDHTVSILLGNGDGTFQSHVDYGAGNGATALGMATADFNGDGLLDLVVPGTRVSVLLGKGDGTFEPFSSFSIGQNEADWLAAADFNRDGRPDVVAPNPGNNTVVVLLQTAVGLSETALNFGRQTVGTVSAPKAVTLANVGSTTLTISGITLTGTDPADFSEQNNCSSSLAPGANCRISVVFAPKAKGIRSALATITDDVPGTPQTIALKGNGT